MSDPPPTDPKSPLDPNAGAAPVLPGTLVGIRDERASAVPPITSALEFRALSVLAVVLLVASMITVRHFLAPIIVAAWFSALTAPLVGRVSRKLGGRTRVAALSTVALALLIIVPIVLLALPLYGMIVSAVTDLLKGSPTGMLHKLNELIGRTGVPTPRPGAGGGAAAAGGTQRVFNMVREVAPGAASIVTRTFGVLTSITVQIFILCLCAYYFSANGAKILARIEQGSPLAPSHLRRFMAAFMDVAKAMLVGEILTAIAQGVVAAVIYTIVDVPHVLFFAVLTAFAALVPTLGAALVWVPLCGVLLLNGRTKDAAILAVCGVVIISLVDNVLRPFFARMGADKMHPLVLFLGIFGGLETFGGWGLILGPLVLALFLAAYRLYADEAATRRRAHQLVHLAGDDGPVLPPK